MHPNRPPGPPHLFARHFPRLSTVFISHLTNSGGCGNLQPKVSLTVSPFSPSFPPQLNLFPHSLRAVSPVFTAFTPNRALTPLSTAFTQTYRGCGGTSQQSSINRSGDF